jgi:TorA maturation chaperone TorD
MEQMHNPASPENLHPNVDDIDGARAQEYALLATLLSRSPDVRMIECVALLHGDTTPLGTAHAALARAAARANPEGVKIEFFDLFDGLGRSRFLPYASYYLTGSLYGRPLARVRETLRSLGIKRAEHYSEPEDHAAILCEIMAGLAGGSIAAQAGTDRVIFKEHLAPWIGRFFDELERNGSAEFYARVGAVGRTFIEIEIAAFALLP